jgi:hypothetical protein
LPAQATSKNAKLILENHGEKWMDFVASHGSFLVVIGDYFDDFTCDGQLGNLLKINEV